MYSSGISNLVQLYYSGQIPEFNEKVQFHWKLYWSRGWRILLLLLLELFLRYLC